MEQSPAKIVFITGHEFGETVFKEMYFSDEYGVSIEFSLLLTLDSQKEKVTVGYQDLSWFAKENNIPVQSIRSIKSSKVEAMVAEAQPDYLLIIGWSELAPPTLLDLPMKKHQGTNRHSTHYGCIGMHPTLLPQGRGRAPIPWAIIKNLTKTGVTSFLLEANADAGAIVDQVEIPLSPTHTATQLFSEVREAHTLLSRKLVLHLSTRKLTGQPQNDDLASYWPRRKPSDGAIDFSKDAHTVSRLVRALTSPYPGAFFFYKGIKISVDKVLVENITHDEFGKIIDLDATGCPLITTVKGSVRLLNYTPKSTVFQIGSLVNTIYMALNEKRG